MLTLLFVAFCSCSAVKEVIAQLSKRVSSHQAKTNQSFSPPAHWFKTAGLYDSFVKLNFCCSPEMALARSGFSIYDENGFVTLWVLELMVDSQLQFGVAEVPQEDVEMAVQALAGFRDKNRARGNTTVFSFWPQKEVNGTWTAWPRNLQELITVEGAMTGFVEKVLKSLHLEHLLAEVESVMGQLNAMFSAFRIPADYDDTSAAIVLGSLLHEAASKGLFARAAEQWFKDNTAFDAMTRSLASHLYRPGAGTLDASTIDPRSYFLLDRYFAAVSPQNVTLFPTWVQSISELTRGGGFAKGVAMPFNVNNIDMSVVANVIGGIAKAAMAGVPQMKVYYEDGEILEAVRESSKFVAWVIDTDVLDEFGDIALLYYPPKLFALLSVARTVKLLNSRQAELTGIWPETLGVLLPAVRGAGTRLIERTAKWSGASECFWSDFLGTADVPKPHMDDAKFTTAAALAVLLDSWTTVAPGSQRSTWSPDTPQAVKDLVQAGAAWLTREALSPRMPDTNAFFSGSVKLARDLPYQYPVTVSEFVNGTAADPRSPSSVEPDLIGGVQGSIPSAVYQGMLKQSWHGFPPLLPAGPSSGSLANATFPFWSAPALTDALCVYFLSAFEALG